VPDRDRYLERLAVFCAADSFTGDVDGTDAAAHRLASWAREDGLGVELVPSPVGVHVVASTLGAGRGRTLLLGHHDTVFPPGTGASRPVTVSAGRAYGPGVADMKGGVLVALEALRVLAADPSGPHGLVELHCVPDEEGRNVEPFTLDRMRGATACLCFECGRESGAIVTVRKAGTWLTLTAEGRAAHAGTEPHLGRSALMALLHETLRIRAEVDGARRGMTANVTWIRAGDVKNTIPDAGEAIVDLRAETAADLEWALARIGAFGSHDGITLVRSDDRGFPPMERDAHLAARTLALLAEHGAVALEETAGGVSDASWTSSVGVPTVDGLGPVGGLDHTVDEYIELASVAPRVATTIALCREIGSQ
jgi:glutamate carboxypeptidase